MLKFGKLAIFKIFLQIKRLFEKSEPRYLLNRLYIDDFCVFLQSVDEKEFQKKAEAIEKILPIDKEELGLSLVEIETEANEINEIAEGEKKLSELE